MASSKTREFDSLLNDPSGSHEVPERTAVISGPVDHNAGFLLGLEARQYRQYASTYYMRLEMLRSAVLANAKQAWDDLVVEGRPVHYVPKVLDINQGRISWVVGTVYKEMKYKPNILEDVSASHYGAPPVRREKYIDPDTDALLLEDESGRLKLAGDVINREILVTGSIVAVLGTENVSGEFSVIDIKTAGFAPQAPLPSTRREPRFLALVSGLDMNGKEDFKIDLLEEYLSGELGAGTDQIHASQISQLILAGDSLGINPEDSEKVQTKSFNSFGQDSAPFDPAPIHRFDQFFAEVASSIPVTLMPGHADPVSHTMPQQALHQALFSKTRPLIKSGAATLSTNPFWHDLDGVRILGTSGQNISDIYKYVADEDRLAMMVRTLEWRHIAPTAPDTLWSYPFVHSEPFVLTETPHVYFAGNQPEYGTSLVSGTSSDGSEVTVRVIAVPRFSTTGQIVLVNLDNLEASVISIAGFAGN